MKIHPYFTEPVETGKGINLKDPLHDLAVALVEPEIPGNVGSIARTCVGTNTPLLILGPIPFEITDRKLKRAGLDYWKDLKWGFYEDRAEFHQDYANRRLVLTSAHATDYYHDFEFHEGDVLVFGKETRGLDECLTSQNHPLIKLPMWGKTRSLNLSNAATTVLYEAYRQLGFPKE